jgi:RNA:NAD 2'-phosphotransferase (TPT1/KptA family)
MLLDALRHDPERYDLYLDEEGFVDTESIVYGLQLSQPMELPEALIKEALEDGEGTYFDVRDGNQYRALTGHTTEQFDYPIAAPEQDLFYLINGRDLKAVQEEGLGILRKKRYLMLETSVADALDTKGRRRVKKPVVLRISPDATTFHFFCDTWYCEDASPFSIQVESQ